MLQPHAKSLLAAQGYTELSMFDDALREIALLPLDVQEHPTVVELRLAVLMQAKRWKPALAVSQQLCQLVPENPTGYLRAAFCMHELGRTREARDLLLEGPQTLHEEATFHYNLACYECRLGNLELARMHLDKSFTLDKELRDFSKGDSDLDALRE